MAKRDIDFLLEMGSLRNVPRAWQQVISGRVANIPEHVFRTVFIAWTIALAEGADASKVIKMTLLHDIGESRVTDIAFMHRQYVSRNEDLARKHIFADTTLQSEAAQLLKEYNDRQTLESKIVKDADNLDVDFELKEHAKFGDSAAISMQKDHRPHVRKVKLYTATAKALWDDIQKADPDGWHRKLTNQWIKNKKAAR